jgi:hypothetical protein
LFLFASLFIDDNPFNEISFQAAVCVFVLTQSNDKKQKCVRTTAVTVPSPFNHYHAIRNAAETKRKQLLAAIRPTGIQHHHQ